MKRINRSKIKTLLPLLALLLFCSTTALGQIEEFVIGDVGEENEDGVCFPLAGASVIWLGTSNGAFTDLAGSFKVKKEEATPFLVVNYTGYQSDTIDTRLDDYFHIHLVSSLTLDEVEVVHRRKSTEVSYLNPIKVEQIGEKELLKAACCNLSESFETSPSVDVSFTDAVTGTRQIQLLGLAGPYSQITRENMPHIRGLSAVYGLTYVPGSWVQSIQLNKGTGSVLNGYESIAGQINVELKKPEKTDRFFLNLYSNLGGRLEANANAAFQLKEERWYTGLFFQGVNNTAKWDRNKDGFLDHPLKRNFIGLNRWRYTGPKGIRSQFGIKGTLVFNNGGQKDYNHKNPSQTPDLWGLQLDIQRLEAWGKIGRVFEEAPWKTYGFQGMLAHHNQQSYFGLRQYDAIQTSGYLNFIYQSIFKTTDHVFKLGTSVQYDDYQESLDEANFDRTEVVPGAYFEYTYNLKETFNIVLGVRSDYHNQYGLFFTPRMHLRYAINDNSVLRASAGRGQRTANIISENFGLLASARQLTILGDGSDKPFGLEAEVAWNYGINFTQTFKLANRQGRISADFYRTDFENQIVVDLDQDPQQAIFYNLSGKSFSNSFQLQVDYELIKQLDLRLAYRWFDVHTSYNLPTIGDELRAKPLVAPHRAFMNLGYSTNNNWKFDYTITWQGTKRIPFTMSNPIEYQFEENSPGFVLMNAQISKSWKEKFEVYVGGENLTGFTQKNPILASDKPFSDYFDSSMIWGPVFGRNIYIGFRYRLP